MENTVKPYNKYQTSNSGVLPVKASPPLLSWAALPTPWTVGVNELDWSILVKYTLLLQAGFRNVNACRRIYASGWNLETEQLLINF